MGGRKGRKGLKKEERKEQRERGEGMEKGAKKRVRECEEKVRAKKLSFVRHMWMMGSEGRVHSQTYTHTRLHTLYRHGMICTPHLQLTSKRKGN